MSRFYSALILPKLILPLLLLLLIPVYAGSAFQDLSPEKEAKAAGADVAESCADGALSDGETFSAMADADGAVTLLFAGYDRESSYAGSILLVRLDRAKSTLRTVQIRGNCYVRDPACPDGRLGSAFAEGCRLAKESGADETAAKRAGIRALADTLQKVLGIKTDGGVSLDYDSFRDIVDRADGVDVNLPRDFTCSDGLRLHAGKNHLNGRDAERFMRFGESDGTVHPQRLFLGAFMKKVKKEFSLPQAIALGYCTYRHADTDLGLADLLSLFRSALAVDLSNARMAELAGAKLEIGGTEMQVVNRNWARDLVNSYLDAGIPDDQFDPGELLTDPGNAEIEEIYRGRAPGMNGWDDAYNIPSYLSAASFSVGRNPFPHPTPSSRPPRRWTR